MSAKYLNVDLDLESAAPLAPLLAAMGDRICVLYHDPKKDGPVHRAHVELTQLPGGTSESAATPEITLTGFCDLLESLPAESRAMLKACQVRCLNVGFETYGSTTSKPDTLITPIAPATLKRATALGLGLTVTIYAK